MEQLNSFLIAYIEPNTLLAPIIFISIHLLRSFIFLPVIFICISGGILFGPFVGTVYSVIGITLSSVLFYALIRRMPKTLIKFLYLKEKVIGNDLTLTTTQITLLKLIPFIHFHLLSLYLIEISTSFKDYTKLSLFSNLPLVFLYTLIGKWISNISVLLFSFIIALLLLIIYLLRRKETNIKWHDFFQATT